MMDYYTGSSYETSLDSGYVDYLKRKHCDEGEKKLMLAVLQEALNNYVQSLSAKDNEESKQKFLEVESWFLNPTDEWLFSFRNIADTLGIDPSYFISGLNRMKENKLRGWRLADAKVKPFRIGRTAYRTRYSALAKNRAYRKANKVAARDRFVINL